jgi:hypothetical protein
MLYSVAFLQFRKFFQHRRGSHFRACIVWVPATVNKTVLAAKGAPVGYVYHCDRVLVRGAFGLIHFFLAF